MIVTHKKIKFDVAKLIKEMREENYSAAEKYVKWFKDVSWNTNEQV